MSREEGGFFSGLLGIFVGLISGTVIGLLVAPKTGEDLRDDLSNKARELSDNTAHRVEEIKEASKSKVTEVADNLNKQASSISNKLDELSKSGSEVLVKEEV